MLCYLTQDQQPWSGSTHSGLDPPTSIFSHDIAPQSHPQANLVKVIPRSSSHLSWWLKFVSSGQMLTSPPRTAVLGRLRQEDYQKSEVNLHYTGNSKETKGMFIWEFGNSGLWAHATSCSFLCPSSHGDVCTHVGGLMWCASHPGRGTLCSAYIWTTWTKSLACSETSSVNQEGSSQSPVRSQSYLSPFNSSQQKTLSSFDFCKLIYGLSECNSF